MHTRIHPLRHAPGKVWIKRDDELGFGTSGSKARKWVSLLPALLSRGITDVLVEGGPSSNNCVLAAQILRQHGLTPHFVFRQSRANPRTAHTTGNRLLLELLTLPEEVQWLGRIGEIEYKTYIAQYVAKLQALGKKVVVIPEGSSCREALAGILTLGEDIVRNEREHRIHFDRIFIDAGTGLTAIGCILGMLKNGRQPSFEIILMAGGSTNFESELARHWSVMNAAAPAPTYRLHRPHSGRSFGAVTAKVLDFIRYFAHSEGVLTDPIYTGKLFHTAYAILSAEQLQGHSLIIHTGGGTSLFGFADRFKLPASPKDKYIIL